MRLLAHAPARQLLVLAAVLIVATGAAAALLLTTLRADALAGGHRLGASFARMIEEQSTRSFQAVEQRLQLAAGRYDALRARGPLDEAAGRAFLRAQLHDLPFLRAIWIVGADGRIVHDSDAGNTGREVGDRPYVRDAREHPEAGFRLGNPLLSRTVGTWLITASVPLRTADGAFGGVMAAAIEPPYFDTLWRSLGMGERVTVTLLRRDGTLMMHSPFDPSQMANPPPGLTIPRLALERHPAGQFEKVGAFDGVTRLFAYRALSVWPDLVVVVGQPVADVTAGWRRMARALGVVWALGALLVGGLCLQLARSALARHDSGLELRRSEQRLRTLLATVSSGVVIHDAATRIVDANPAACTMLGSPLEHLLGLTADAPDWQFIEEDGSPMAAARLPVRQVLDRGQPVHDLLVGMAGRSGRGTRWALCSAHALADAGGHIEQVVVVFSEITAWRQAQQQIVAAQRELASTLSAIPDLLFELDREGRYLQVHAGRAHLMAAPAASLVGKPVHEVLPPAAATEVMAALAEAEAAGHSDGRQLALELPQGPSWFEMSVSRKGAAGEAVPTFLVLSRDITRRKRAEDDLQRINRALRVLGAGNRALLHGHAEQDLLEAVCRQVVGAGGYTMAWIGLPVDDAARSVRVAAHAGEVGTYLDDLRVSWDASVPEGQGPTGLALCTGEVQVNDDYEGDPRMAPWRERALAHGFRASVALPLPGPQRTLGALMLYAPDRHAFDAVALGPLQELARNVAITIETLRAQRQRDAANDANQAKSRFLASISHEIRTPINAILGLVHLLQRDEVTPRQGERLHKVARAARHLLSIVNDVLELSRIEAGGLVLRVAPFELRAVFDHVHEMIGEAARAKGLQVRIGLDGAPARLAGDEVRIRQALLNLAANALKFTERGSITMAAQVLASGDEGVLLRWSVQDTGIGVPASDLERIFGAFEQAAPPAAGGTGLGLAIVRRLARLMGGDAGVDSRPGQGSTFWFTTWLQPAGGAAAPAAEVPLEALERALAERHAGTRLLLAEDNLVNREIVCALLEPLPLRVDCAVDGLQAVAMAGAARYDLVLMDMQMPGIDGPEATRRIRRLPGGEALPIVALTANAFDDSRRECREAGMSDFLAKPIEPQALLARLLQWLDAGAAVTPPAR